jgi:hypothetical protein
MKMTPKEKAQDLVNQFRMILMDEDTDCGNEILCTSIAVKNAMICAQEVMSRVPYCSKIGADWITDDLLVDYWVEVRKELRKM